MSDTAEAAKIVQIVEARRRADNADVVLSTRDLDYLSDDHYDFDSLIGRKVQHEVYGRGTLVALKDGKHGVRIRLRCGCEGCTGTITVYLCSGCYHGAYCYAYDRFGTYEADLRNQWFMCKTHQPKKKKAKK